MTMKPLEGILCLDMSRVLAGPFASMRLADLGARVIKIEPLEGDPTRRFGPPFVDGESVYFMSLNRGKESVRLDPKVPAAAELLARIIRRADVLLENFRPGGLAKLGFDERRLKLLNPRLITCRISGFGSRHPRCDEPVFDLAIQAESGFMAMTGESDGPPVRAGVSLADLAAGGAAVEAILAALFHRERRGAAAHLEVSLIDGMLALFNYQAQTALLTGEEPARLGSGHPNLVPYQAFATRDGWVVLAVAVDDHWRRFVGFDPATKKVLDRPEWATNAARVKDRAAVVAAVAKVMAERTSAVWIDAMAKAGVPIGACRKVGEVLAEYRARGDDFLADYPHARLGSLPMTGSPIIWDGCRPQAPLGPPLLGDATNAVIDEFAVSPDEAAYWRRSLVENTHQEPGT